MLLTGFYSHIRYVDDEDDVDENDDNLSVMMKILIIIQRALIIDDINERNVAHR